MRSRALTRSILESVFRGKTFVGLHRQDPGDNAVQGDGSVSTSRKQWDIIDDIKAENSESLYFEGRGQVRQIGFASIADKDGIIQYRIRLDQPMPLGDGHDIRLKPGSIAVVEPLDVEYF